MDWEELYIKYSDDVFKFIFFMTYEKEIAEDLTHDTFIKVKKSLTNFRGESSYYTWIISIARNVTYDYLRRKHKIKFLSFHIRNHSKQTKETAEELVLNEESLKELYRAINNLKVNYKEVVILRKIQGLSVEETAQALGWSKSKVKSTMQRALEKLKQEITHLDIKEG
ncbi:RNA polymerase sigma factor [Sutcliffiella sp. NC1]|uniref:RNA polymerase sigma factor n=1 Tax=Sutcliffiella sp. NC1 TaxID=3004096 RepID=UPI0022DE3479|nr:RNA polymerase sigma factor [Sutcliffiella sp. NC1]WBL16899.1 RNA polymerase sigma factor [Sutcliffiella sp. NC1]